MHLVVGTVPVVVGAIIKFHAMSFLIETELDLQNCDDLYKLDKAKLNALSHSCVVHVPDFKRNHSINTLVENLKKRKKDLERKKVDIADESDHVSPPYPPPHLTWSCTTTQTVDIMQVLSCVLW